MHEKGTCLKHLHQQKIYHFHPIQLIFKQNYLHMWQLFRQSFIKIAKKLLIYYLDENFWLVLFFTHHPLIIHRQPDKEIHIRQQDASNIISGFMQCSFPVSEEDKIYSFVPTLCTYKVQVLYQFLVKFYVSRFLEIQTYQVGSIALI